MPKPDRYTDRIITSVRIVQDVTLGTRGGEYELDYKPVGYGEPPGNRNKMFPFKLELGERAFMFIFETTHLCRELIEGVFETFWYEYEGLNAIAVDLSTGDLYVASFHEVDDNENDRYTMSVLCSPLNRGVPKKILPVLGELTPNHHSSLSLPAYALNGFISRDLGYRDLAELMAVEIDLFGTSLDSTGGNSSVDVLEGTIDCAKDSDGCKLVVYKNHYLVINTDLGVIRDEDNTVSLTFSESLREEVKRLERISDTAN